MMSKRRKQALVPFYIVSMAFASNSLYGDHQLSYKPQLMVGLLWVLIGLICFLFNPKSMDKSLKKLMGAYLLPHIVIHLYTIILSLLGKIPSEYISSNLTVYIPTMLAIISVYIFGTRALYYSAAAIFLAWAVSIMINLVLKGPLIVSHAILEGWFNTNPHYPGINKNYFELHDIVLGIGYFLCSYMFSKDKLSKKDIRIIVFVLIIMILGVKRIAILGVIAAVGFHLVIKRLKSYTQYRICRIGGYGIIAVCFLFLYVMFHADAFFSFTSKIGIDPRGRQYYYQAVLSLVDFSPSFIGLGRGVIAHLMSADLSYLRVGGVHSDIIKMYVENGFIMFALWLVYYCAIMPKLFNKNFGAKASVIYFSILIYQFVLYLTDNVEVYFVCILLAVMIPTTYAQKEMEKRMSMLIRPVRAA